MPGGRLWLAATLPLAICGAARAEGPEMGRIEAYFYYRDSGQLSSDLLGRTPPFDGWNSVIGEGDAEGEAQDLLVVVPILSDHVEILKDPLEVWVTDPKGKVLGRRKFDGVLAPEGGKVRNPLWLNEVACAGKLTLHARFKRREITDALGLYCGE